MTITVVENVRGFFGSRPPLVAFMIFLASMAVGLITFASFVSDMPKAVIDQEFNKFLERLSVLNLCVGEERGVELLPGNASQSAASGARQGKYVEQMKQADVLAQRDRPGELPLSTPTLPPSSSSAAGSLVVNMSTLMAMEVAATAGFQGFASQHNSTTITATVWASQLGRAEYRQDMEVNISVALFLMGNGTQRCLQGGQGQCYRGRACVTITAPRPFFPRAWRPDAFEKCHRNPDPGAEQHLHGEIAVGKVPCLGGSFVHLRHLYDPTNRAIMFIPERSAINLHLIHSSYFLFVMVISLFCYAIIKGRPSKVKVVHIQSASDKHALIQV